LLVGRASLSPEIRFGELMARHVRNGTSGASRRNPAVSEWHVIHSEPNLGYPQGDLTRIPTDARLWCVGLDGLAATSGSKRVSAMACSADREA